MKTLAATIGCAVCEWGLTTTWADTALDAATAVQGIQQASDPSAAVSAYASGFAADRTNVVLHNAYVTRMVDFGLPELAYHQAQLLVSLDTHNGLAWGVVAHVNARRTDMPGAISAITLAAQSSPEHPFVQHTAGEVLAWYDAKGAQAYMSEDCRAGIAKTRAVMTNRLAFTDAYNAARRAYAEQTNAAEPAVDGQPTPPADSGPYASSPPPPPTYDPADIYSDWGPDWVDYWPWYWWWPCGGFFGCHFSPCHRVLAFNCFHHHHFNTAWCEHGTWHHNAAGRPVFFGGVPRPGATVAASSRAAFASHFTGVPAAGQIHVATLASTGANQGEGSGSRLALASGDNTSTHRGHELAISWQSGGASANAHANTHAATAFYHTPHVADHGNSSALASNDRESHGMSATSRESSSASNGGRILQLQVFSNHTNSDSESAGGGGGGGWHGGSSSHDGGGRSGGWHSGGGFHGGGGGGHGGGGGFHGGGGGGSHGGGGGGSHGGGGGGGHGGGGHR